jgi:hypothetical protein
MKRDGLRGVQDGLSGLRNVSNIGRQFLPSHLRLTRGKG